MLDVVAANTSAALAEAAAMDGFDCMLTACRLVVNSFVLSVWPLFASFSPSLQISQEISSYEGI